MVVFIYMGLLELRGTRNKQELHKMEIAIFFVSNLYLKQGIDKVYVMVDFICMGLLELRGTRIKKELHNEDFLSTMGFEPTTLSHCIFL